MPPYSKITKRSTSSTLTPKNNKSKLRADSAPASAPAPAFAPAPASLPSLSYEKSLSSIDISPKDDRPKEEPNETFRNEVERFIEISKHFSSPLRKTASYMCENSLVSYPSPYSLEYKRGGITTQYIKFFNLTLQPVYVKLYKVIPDLEKLKFINLSLSRCKRIPPGLSFNLGIIYSDVDDKPHSNAKMIFVASRKTSTPCYQVCEIELLVSQQRVLPDF